jgi:(p)ppGpp synthase/HD superfamily hydrolase
MFRDSGEPYLDHCFDVGGQLKEMKMDDKVIIAGLIHDLIEDTKMTAKILAKALGPRVAFLVDAVSKRPIDQIPDRDERNKEFHQRMIVCARQDFAVIFLKAADNLHNLVTLHGLINQTERKRRFAQETMDFYLPLLEGEAQVIVPKELHHYLDEYAWQMRHLSQVYLGQLPDNTSKARLF